MQPSTGVSALLAVVVLLSVGVSVSATGIFNIWTSKSEYQYGEDIVINWANLTSPGSNSYYVGLFIAGRCSSTPYSCVTTGASTQYFTYTSMQTTEGTWTLGRANSASFRGLAEIIGFSSAGPLGAVNVSVIGT
jgi:hypothetical protein